MTAKPVQQPDSLVSSLQSEVALEASPLLAFLVTHAAKIAVGIVLFILAIGGYWFYSSHMENRRVEESKALGQLMIISDPRMRLEKLEAFLPDAPASVQGAAWFAVLDASIALQDNDKIYAAWERISKLDPNMAVPAALGMSSALAAEGKNKEALTVLEGLALTPQSLDFFNVQTHIALLSELLGDYKRAAAASDALSSAPGIDPNEGKFWAQKKAELESRSADAPQ